MSTPNNCTGPQAKEEHADPCHPTLHSNVLDGCRIMFPNTWGCHAATFMKSLLLRVKHVSSPSQVHSNHISNLPTNGVVKCKHWIILYFASRFPLYLRCAGCVFFITIHWWLCTTNQLCQCNFRLGLTKLMKGITTMFLQSWLLHQQRQVKTWSCRISFIFIGLPNEERKYIINFMCIHAHCTHNPNSQKQTCYPKCKRVGIKTKVPTE